MNTSAFLIDCVAVRDILDSSAPGQGPMVAVNKWRSNIVYTGLNRYYHILDKDHPRGGSVMPTLVHTSTTVVSDGGRIEAACALSWQEEKENKPGFQTSFASPSL